ncbi:hypothetical protein C8R46DRAFT_1232492 [Mycena filopes]|nr:hypothetical protein C8R46DRAFT_1237034 [Mycena filopes]KAJ7144678.1 hypothetical protein C8R46DRAFT_1232492 [Mycena filopes]
MPRRPLPHLVPVAAAVPSRAQLKLQRGRLRPFQTRQLDDSGLLNLFQYAATQRAGWCDVRFSIPRFSVQCVLDPKHPASGTPKWNLPVFTQHSCAPWVLRSEV